LPFIIAAFDWIYARARKKAWKEMYARSGQELSCA